jgi:hypothetical protein
MKKIITTTILLIGLLLSAQQKAGVERSLTGIQIGILGLDIYNEARLTDELVLRSQFSLNPSIWGGDLYSKTGFALTPSISLAPKYYYNIKKRQQEGKNTANNSANYFSLKIEYFPNWFVISNTKDLSVNDAIYFTPNYGFRRNFATNFNYEFRAGIGFGKIFKGNYGVQARPELSFKVGYDF